MTMKTLHPGRRSGSPLSWLSLMTLGVLCLRYLAAGSVLAAGDDDFFTHIHTARAMANVTVSPGRAGPVDIAIQLETMAEQPLMARAVSVTLSDAKSGKRRQAIPAELTGDDRWHVKIPKLAAGRWTLGLGIAVSDTDKFTVEAPILIK
jgi:hypothetical protein